MKIAFFNATTGWGGVKTWTIDVAEELQNLGHDVVLIGKDDRFRNRAVSKNIRAFNVKFGADFSPISIIKFLLFLQKEQPDAIIVNVSKELRTVGIAAKLLGIPLIQRIGLPKDMKRCAKVQLLDKILRPHYLFPCNYNLDGMLEHLPFVKKDRTSTVYTGKPTRPNLLSTSSDTIQFVTTSQLNRKKGHAELMEAMSLLAKQGSPFHWHIVGTGTEEELLKKRCSELNLSEHVTWHGWVQNVFPLLEKADCFVLPSFFEGLPNTLLEAMSCGLIPIARDVGGIHEAWPQGFEDLLIAKAEKASTWASRLQEIIELPKETLFQKKLSVKQHMETNFNITTQAAMLAEEIKRIS
ncbi:glycosyltransferase [Halodesulfovibrio aestuarii]|uniref:Glycosyltransferase involved in cell wall bisynthesis n=1 Tax=Halodesulfovibrio aestuarii TaxID=126333 RepID=A0A8G2C965_9BACT|nr:glycosyltransferase [Halodesulfovibrio aestuarii]SHJ04440.1 Glycosyltransferase involved in cell wall bisynthesis [Halodesulfovibrio aestuarii]